MHFAPRAFDGKASFESTPIFDHSLRDRAEVAVALCIDPRKEATGSRGEWDRCTLPVGRGSL